MSEHPPIKSRIHFNTSRLLTPAVLVGILYLALIFILPANKLSLHQYHLSILEYRALLFAVALPSIGSWIAAFVGYIKLKQYVLAIRKSPEGSDFDTLARGYAWLAWSLPIAALVSLVLTAAVNQWPQLLGAAIVIRNYLNLLLPLIAFTVIGAASRGLVNRAKLSFSSASIRSIVLIFLAAGVVYCYLTFQQFDLTSLGSAQNPYHLPLWLMVLTVIIPSLYAWFIGLLATYEIMLFSNRTDGVLYRSALRMLVAGLTIIIVSLIAIQFTSSVNPGIGRLVLGYRLVVILACRLVGIGGFVLVALGANRLKTIEEI